MLIPPVMANEGPEQGMEFQHREKVWEEAGLLGDVKGGLVAAFISLPMSMGMGIVAFSPLGVGYVVQGAIAGIYGAIIVGLVAYAFGARTLMMPGPRSAPAVICASLMTQLLGVGYLAIDAAAMPAIVIAMVFFAMLLAGMAQAFLGFFRYGNLVRYIPRPVFSGFVNSSALLIILSQACILFGVMPGESLWVTLSAPESYMSLSILPGVVALLTVVLLDGRFKSFPVSFLGLITGAATYYALKFGFAGADVGTTLGVLSQNLPTVQIEEIGSIIANLSPNTLLLLLGPAVISLAAVGSLETSMSIAYMDQMTGQRARHNRELAAQGLANITAAGLGGFFSTGGVVRTKPAFDSGARSGRAVVFCSLFLLIAVLGLADMIEYLPRAVVAGVVMGVGFQIFDRESLGVFRRCLSRQVLQRTNTLTDASVVLTVMISALVFDLIVAVLVGIVLAFIVFVASMSRSVVHRVGRGPNIHSRSDWDPKSQSIIEEFGHKIAVAELEGVLFFGTTDGLQDVVRGLIADGASYIILDMKRVSQIDSSGADVLKQLSRLVRRANGRLFVSYVLEERRKKSFGRVKKKSDRKPSDRRRKGMPRVLWQTFDEMNVIEVIGVEQIFPDTDSALIKSEQEIIRLACQSDQAAKGGARFLPSVVQGLTRDQIKFLQQNCDLMTFDTEDIIFEEGADGDALYLLSRGRAEVHIYLYDQGQRKRVHTLLGGSVFGEMALLDRKPRAATVKATERTECYRLSIDAFESIKRDEPELALILFNNLCMMFSERMRAANNLISELEK